MVFIAEPVLYSVEIHVEWIFSRKFEILTFENLDATCYTKRILVKVVRKVCFGRRPKRRILEVVNRFHSFYRYRMVPRAFVGLHQLLGSVIRSYSIGHFRINTIPLSASGHIYNTNLYYTTTTPYGKMRRIDIRPKCEAPDRSNNIK